PVDDGRRHGLAGQEVGAARSEEDGAVEVDRLAEGDLEVGHADAQVVELEYSREPDLAGAAGGLARVPAAARLVDQLRLADGEAVGVNHEARLAAARVDLSRDAERREGDLRLVH